MRGLIACLALLLPMPVSAAEPGAGELPAAALQALPGAEVVLLGEVHDNARHQQLQAQAVSILQPAAIVWEMMTPEQAGLLPDDRSDPAVVDVMIGWSGRGWPPLEQYHPIMLAAPQALHLGAEVTRDQARRVFEAPLPQVFTDLFDVPAARYGLDRALSPDDQAGREAHQAAVHCHAMPEHLLPGMVAAQRLRDGALAHVALQALEATGGPVAVITGGGHARRDIGMPRKLSVAAPEVSILSLAFLEADPGPDAPFDHWLVTDAPEREDPCAAFAD